MKEKREIKDFSAGYERDLDRSIKALNELEGEKRLYQWLSRSCQSLEVVLFDLELSGCIDPNFRLFFVRLDPTNDFDVFSFDARQYERFRDR